MRRTFTPTRSRFSLALLLSLGLLLRLTPGRAQAPPAGEGLVADSTELRVLRQLYTATAGDQWTRRTNWLQGTSLAEAATWAGVQVSGGDVTGLLLSHNNLVGTLPDGLSLLTSLRQFEAASNRLTGEIPASLGNCTRLGFLELSSNALTGPLPASLSQATGLGYLNLSFNQLTGPLPASWCRLRGLGRLSVRYNQLDGLLPDSLGMLTNLNTLELDHNQLSGPVPSTLGRLTRVAYLSLDHNRLTGPLPDLGGLTAVLQLTLSDNRLTGAIPASLATLPQLYLLGLSNNLFTSCPSWQAAPRALNLLLENNQLDFGSLEPNFSGPRQPLPGSDFRYWNQTNLAPAEMLTVVQQQPATLHRAMGGAHNHYQWQRWVGGQWADLPGATDTTLVRARVQAADAGLYRQRVTNDWFTGFAESHRNLVLTTQPFYLDVLPYRALTRNRPDDQNQGLASQPLTSADSAAWHSAAAPADVNYVRVWTPRVALTQAGRVAQAPVDSVAQSTQYLDGLGRPVQTVQRQASPQRRDLVQPQAYDGLGREPRTYLPYPGQQQAHGGYYPQALRQQDAFYRPTTSPNPPAVDDPTRGVARTGAAYAETQFEASPLGRVTAQGAPGEAWQLTAGHVVERVERPNTALDSVLWFVPDYDPTRLDPGYRGFYNPGELWGTDVADVHGPSEPGAHGYRTIEWKDKLGQVVLRQVEAARTGTTQTGLASRWLRTAYVYDDFGRLRFVLQPEGVTRLLASLTAPSLPAAGTIIREQWDNVPGTAVSDIPLATPPTRTRILPALEGPTDVADNYGDRIRGYLLPRQTGAYSFWLAGDDNCEFWLSSDADPAHKQRLAYVPNWTSSREWTRFPSQQSAPVQLVAGERYYLEVLHKEGGGGDNLAVTWQLPDSTGFGLPIAGQYLAPYVAPTSEGQPLALFLFRYRYDGRGRQIAKQVPGQEGETLVVYDQLDRPILSQDPAQRSRKEWSLTKYDPLGRIVLSGLVTQQDTIGQVRLQALASADTAASHQYEVRVAAGSGASAIGGYSYLQSFPRLGQDGFVAVQALNLSYYDDYDFDNDGQPDVAYDTSQDGQFVRGQAPVADVLRTTSLVTRTQTRVLGVAESTDPTQPAAWLTTTTFYDERARPIQVQTRNARRGLDVLTTQLDFTGKVVQSVASHQGPLLSTPLLVTEQFTYDHTGRLLTSRQQLPGEAHPALLDSVSYNELGQVVRKTLGTGRLRQDVDYAYNIRGWLTRLNDPYFPVQGNLFNLSLHYERGFTRDYEQYNGNLTGQTWRGRDGVQRAYGYVYDPLNRLLQGDYVARQTTTAGAWRAEEDNYRLSFVSYDDNGNIRTLRRQGLLQNATSRQGKQYGAVDNLTYAYQGNRLLAVDDAVSGNQLPQPAAYHGAPTSLAGDFQEAGVQLGEEYRYDANGNLTQDKNKGITGIAYNHLNLPRQIHFGAVGDSVVFRYTAGGQKVAKLVYQTGKSVQRTDYLGPYQYEQDSLRFFPHAEGRVLRFVSGVSGAVRYQREYTLKDHLGNLRLAYRAGQVRTLKATLEQDRATRERETQQFDSLSVSQPIAVVVPNTYSNGAGSWAARLNAGGATPHPLGPLTQLGVQKGDTVTVSAAGFYPQAQQRSFWFSLGTFLAGLVGQQPSAPVGGEPGRGRKSLPLLQVGVAAGLEPLRAATTGVPLGYLRLLVFDKDSALVRSQTQQVQLTQAANGGYESLHLSVKLAQDGYVTAYVGNESDVNVYFDDVTVEHRQGLQVQETQYDPAGLELAGLAPPSPGIRGLNNYRFNSKEFQADLSLAWNHQDWRFFDPQLLRWHTVDPELENGQESWTPYAFGYDNAIRFADANGRAPDGPGQPTPAKPFHFNYSYQNSSGIHVYRGTVTNGVVNYSLSNIKGSPKNLANISNKSAGVIATSMSKANVHTVNVTSTHRSPRQDAAAMYTNAAKPNGVADGHRLYGANGDKIVDAYAAARGAGLNREQTIDRMTATIVQIGPTKVSHHAFEPAVLNVIDISNSALGSQARSFNAALLSNPEVHPMFSPYTLGHRDPAFHLEIAPSPQSSSTPSPMK